MSPVTLYGRSSSHFTRVARIFAHELDVPYTLHVVRDLASCEAPDYGANPALKIPSLHDGAELRFGSLPIARALSARSARPLRVLWPEQLSSACAANAQELVLQAMATEVSLIVTTSSPSPWRDKLRRSLAGSLLWLDREWDAVHSELAARDLSFLEVTMFCLLTHLDFRQVMPVDDYRALRSFCDRWGERTSARATAYAFDA